MSVVEYQALLSCTPETAFMKVTDLEFLKNIDINACYDVKYISKTDRICKYMLNIQGIGQWESQKIFIPETLTAVSQRVNPLAPFDFLIVLQTFEENNGITKYSYKEQFQVDKDHQDTKEKIFNGIQHAAKTNIDKIINYFSTTAANLS